MDLIGLRNRGICRVFWIDRRQKIQAGTQSFSQEQGIHSRLTLWLPHLSMSYRLPVCNWFMPTSRQGGFFPELAGVDGYLLSLDSIIR
jgi:hypothetical protein